MQNDLTGQGMRGVFSLSAEDQQGLAAAAARKGGSSNPLHLDTQRHEPGRERAPIVTWTTREIADNKRHLDTFVRC